MDQFRPNIVASGSQARAEDGRAGEPSPSTAWTMTCWAAEYRPREDRRPARR